MNNLFGIPLGIDIGTLVGLLATGAVAAGVTRWLQKRLRADSVAEQERVRRAEEKYRTHKEALEIHSSITSIDIFESAERVKTDPAARRFLLATYRRGKSRYLAFQNSVVLDSALESLVMTALGDIAELLPEDLASEQKKVEAKHDRRTNDRTQFRIGRSGPFSKHHTLHEIERRFCKLQGIDTRAQFEQRFGAIVKDVIGADVEGVPFTGATLLHDPSAATPAHKRRYGIQEQKLIADLGPITLDGVPFIAGFGVGYAREPAAIGRRVHRPLIEHFIVQPGYDDITVVPLS